MVALQLLLMGWWYDERSKEIRRRRLASVYQFAFALPVPRHRGGNRELHSVNVIKCTGVCCVWFLE